MVLNKKKLFEVLGLATFPLVFWFLHDDGLSEREAWSRFVVVMLLSIALWPLSRWPNPLGQPLGYKVCFAVFQGLYFGLWMMLALSGEGVIIEPLIFLLLSGGIFGAAMLRFQKGHPNAPPVPSSVWRAMAWPLAVGVFGPTLMILGGGLPLSAAGLVGVAMLFAVPQPSEAGLPKSEARVRQVIGFLLLLGFIGVQVFL